MLWRLLTIKNWIGWLAKKEKTNKKTKQNKTKTKTKKKNISTTLTYKYLTLSLIKIYCSNNDKPAYKILHILNFHFHILAIVLEILSTPFLHYSVFHLVFMCPNQHLEPLAREFDMVHHRLLFAS